jgi:hypothetical protein
MKPKKLEIISFTDAGTAKKKFSCLSGRISVLRATKDEVLSPYIQALSGFETAERISILVDGKNYSAAEHNLIGFEESKTNSSSTVAETLLGSGIEAENLENILVNHGLGGLSQTKVAELSRENFYLFNLLAATNHPEKLLILNYPFVQIPEQWRAQFAQTLESFVWQKQGLVLITNLMFRPESWIDNQLVTRIQIDAVRRRRTIGFGSASDMEYLMPASQTPADASSTTSNDTKHSLVNFFALRKCLPKSVKQISFAVIVILAFALLYSGPSKKSELNIAANVIEKNQLVNIAPTIVSQKNNIQPREDRAIVMDTANENQDNLQVALVHQPISNTPAHSRVLSLYPPEIANAVTLSFYGEVNKMRIGRNGGISNEKFSDTSLALDRFKVLPNVEVSQKQVAAPKYKPQQPYIDPLTGRVVGQNGNYNSDGF